MSGIRSVYQDLEDVLTAKLRAEVRLNFMYVNVDHKEINEWD